MATTHNLQAEYNGQRQIEEPSPISNLESLFKSVSSCEGIPFHLSHRYNVLQRALSMLSAQKDACLNDLRKISELYSLADANPSEFQRKFNNKEIEFPERQKVLAVPLSNSGSEKEEPIDYSYIPMLYYEDMSHIFSNKLIKSRKKNASNYFEELEDDENSQKDETETQQGKFVRGRLVDESKPKSFNQLWTPEEHARLVELLDVYPDEPMQVKRWEKISKALGNRSIQQVASRVQKYFLKLARDGVEIPGRITMGKTKALQTKGKFKRKRMEKLYSKQQSTPTVFMSDDEDAQIEIPEIDTSLKNTSQYKELVRLMKLKKRRAREQSIQVKHDGYKCDVCECEPIIGTRYSCIECENTTPVDMCAECVTSGWANDKHSSSHKMKKCDLPNPTDDYQSSADYSYLDPNYGVE